MQTLSRTFQVKYEDVNDHHLMKLKFRGYLATDSAEYRKENKSTSTQITLTTVMRHLRC